MGDKAQNNDVIIHEADVMLRTKIGGAGALGKLFTADKIVKSQKVIEEFKRDFFTDLAGSLSILRKACEGPVDVEEVKATTKALKSQCETLGFDFLYALNAAAYEYMNSRGTELTPGQMIVVQKHAEAIILAIEAQERGKGGPKESELLETLALLRKKFGG